MAGGTARAASGCPDNPRLAARGGPPLRARAERSARCLSKSRDRCPRTRRETFACEGTGRARLCSQCHRCLGGVSCRMHSNFCVRLRLTISACAAASHRRLHLRDERASDGGGRARRGFSDGQIHRLRIEANGLRAQAVLVARLARRKPESGEQDASARHACARRWHQGCHRIVASIADCGSIDAATRESDWRILADVGDAKDLAAMLNISDAPMQVRLLPVLHTASRARNLLPTGNLAAALQPMIERKRPTLRTEALRLAGLWKLNSFYPFARSLGVECTG